MVLLQEIEWKALALLNISSQGRKSDGNFVSLSHWPQRKSCKTSRVQFGLKRLGLIDWTTLLRCFLLRKEGYSYVFLKMEIPAEGN